MQKFYQHLIVALIAFFVFSGSRPIQAEQMQQSFPQGWHLLYNVGRQQCLDLHRSPIFQRCSQSDQKQQYAVVNDNAIFVNRFSALCLGYEMLAHASMEAHPFFVGEGDCTNQSVPSAIRYRYGIVYTWAIQDAGIGPGNIEQYQIADDSNCLQPYSYQGVIDLVEQACNTSNSSQLWQFR